MILTHSVDIYREVKTNNKLGFDTKILAGMRCNIQPASKETTVLANGSFGKTYAMYAPITASGIAESDKVVITSGTGISGKHFIVKGKENWIVGSLYDHMEFTLFESNE
jgi:hypothetical protein